ECVYERTQQLRPVFLQTNPIVRELSGSNVLADATAFGGCLQRGDRELNEGRHEKEQHVSDAWCQKHQRYQAFFRRLLLYGLRIARERGECHLRASYSARLA